MSDYRRNVNDAKSAWTVLIPVLALLLVAFGSAVAFHFLRQDPTPTLTVDEREKEHRDSVPKAPPPADDLFTPKLNEAISEILDEEKYNGMVKATRDLSDHDILEYQGANVAKKIDFLDRVSNALQKYPRNRIEDIKRRIKTVDDLVAKDPDLRELTRYKQFESRRKDLETWIASLGKFDQLKEFVEVEEEKLEAQERKDAEKIDIPPRADILEPLESVEKDEVVVAKMNGIRASQIKLSLIGDRDDRFTIGNPVDGAWGVSIKEPPKRIGEFTLHEGTLKFKWTYEGLGQLSAHQLANYLLKIDISSRLNSTENLVSETLCMRKPKDFKLDLNLGARRDKAKPLIDQALDLRALPANEELSLTLGLNGFGAINFKPGDEKLVGRIDLCEANAHGRWRLEVNLENPGSGRQNITMTALRPYRNPPHKPISFGEVVSSIEGQKGRFQSSKVQSKDFRDLNVDINNMKTAKAKAEHDLRTWRPFFNNKIKNKPIEKLQQQFNELSGKDRQTAQDRKKMGYLQNPAALQEEISAWQALVRTNTTRIHEREKERDDLIEEQKTARAAEARAIDDTLAKLNKFKSSPSVEGRLYVKYKDGLEVELATFSKGDVFQGDDSDLLYGSVKDEP